MMGSVGHFPEILVRQFSARFKHYVFDTRIFIHTSIRNSRTVSHLLDHWKAAFSEGNISEPMESAEYILSAVLNCSRGDLPRIAKMELNEEQEKDVERRCLCRLQRMPVQYAVGEWEFCDLTLAVRPPVFVPRPETERLALLAAERLSRAPGARRMLEIGCGSGAVTLAVLHWLAQVTAVAVDRSAAACRLTEENALRAGVADRLRVRHATLTADGISDQDPAAGRTTQTVPPLTEEESRGYDLVVSNPPYIPTGELARLQPEIRLYEDHAALDGGADGLRLVLPLVDLAPTWLVPGGTLLLELDHRQPPAVRKLLERPGSGLELVDVHKDFAGKDRFVEARRREDAAAV